MPRSNKKKKLLFQPSVPTDDEAVTQLLREETTNMISQENFDDELCYIFTTELRLLILKTIHFIIHFTV